jgi:hypothetical protein
MSRVTFIYASLAGYNMLLDLGWKLNPPGGPGGPPSTSPTVMVGAPRLLTSPPRGPTIDISDNGGGRSRTPGIASQGVAIDVSDNDGGRSQILGIAS